MNSMEFKNSILVTEFDRYVASHPGFTKRIPNNAQVILQVEGDEKYNRWIRRIAEKQRESGQPVVFVKIKALAPLKSRLIRPRLEVKVA